MVRIAETSAALIVLAGLALALSHQLEDPQSNLATA